MVELTTGYLDFAQLDAEILNVVDDLSPKENSHEARLVPCRRFRRDMPV
jgi:hypothetical protein